MAAPAKSAAVVSPRKDVKTGEAAAKNVDVKSPGPTWAVVGSPPAGGAGGAMCVSCSNALKPGALFCTKCGTKTPVGKAPSAVTATPPSERGGEKQLDKSLGKIPTAAAEKPAEKSTGSIPVIVKAVAKTAPVAEREKDPPVPALMPKKTAEPLKDGPATSSTPPLESSGEGGSRKRSESLRRTTSVSMSTPPAPAAAVGAADGAAPEERRPRGSSIRSPRGESPPVVSVSTSPPVKLVEGDEVSEERRARKGSFRESVALPVTGSRTNLRESMMISAQDRDAAMEKINAMMGSDIPQTVKIACVLEGRVKKTLEVEAIDGIINGRSIQIAWNLSPEQEFHVTFVGLRAPNGEEIPFETSEEVPWPHIPFWEEVIFPDEVYEILYEDDRDVDVDNLTDAEVAKLEKEFDEMDVLKHGFLSREGLTRFFTDQCDRQLRDREGTIDRIMAPGGAAGAGGGRKDRGAKRLDPGILEHVTSQVNVSVFFSPCSCFQLFNPRSSTSWRWTWPEAAASSCTSMRALLQQRLC